MLRQHVLVPVLLVHEDPVAGLAEGDGKKVVRESAVLSQALGYRVTFLALGALVQGRRRRCRIDFD